MEIFLKDNHFKDTIELYPLDRIERDYIKSLIEDKYANINFNVNFFRIGDKNINSQNYKIGDKYLKIIKNIENKEYVKNFPRITEKLKDIDVPCSTFIKSIDNKDIVEKNKIYFYVQEFISDSFFSGTQNELIQVIQILKKLQNIQFNFEIKNLSAPYSNWAPNQTLNKIKKIVQGNLASSDFDHLSKNCINIIEEILNKYENQIKNLIKNTYEYAHFDIHPHNLLFKDGKLKSVIDLESIVNVRKILATSFGLFKISRKCFVKKNINKVEFHNLVNNHFNLEDVKAYTQIELCRRLLLIMKLHYVDGNNKWDFDLIKHFSGIKESNYIFSK